MQQFNLIENALHSLRESIYYYSEADKTENADLYKFSILLSAQCAELLMKEILVRNHPALVLSDIDRSNRSENPETVGYRQAIHRVISLCGIDLSFYKEDLEELGNVRNKMQHYKFEINGEDHNRIMCKAFSAIEFLLIDVLQDSFDSYPNVIKKSDIDYLHELTDVRLERIGAIKREFSSHADEKYVLTYREGKRFSIPCPKCGEDTLARCDDGVKCKMCGSSFADLIEIHAADRNAITESYISRFLGKRRKAGKIETTHCPRCEGDSIVQVEGNWTCLICGFDCNNTKYCDECGEGIPDNDSFFRTLVSSENSDEFYCICRRCERTIRDKERYYGYITIG